MRTIIMTVLACFALNNASGQYTLYAYIRDKNNNEPLPGATVNVAGSGNGNSVDVNGLVVLQNIAAGKQVIQFRATGYTSISDTISFPNNDTLHIYLETEENELEEVSVSTTRSNRTIQDIPTRLEVLNGEELEEKGNMKPGDIRMLLSESTGIQTLQTSATSGNSSIRIEGMDGRYTQILKDGFPLYGGFAGGLGLLQTPPLDLKQVEIVKGSASTLYGGGAIAGLINLISKTPSEKRELNLLINGTSAKGLDINGFYAERKGKLGATVYAAYNGNAAYDPADIGLSAIPKFERFTIDPKLFLYPSDRTEVMIGISASTENRVGGNMKYIKGDGDSLNSYYEQNKSQRISSQAQLKYRLNKQRELTLRNSVGYFNRSISIPGYLFEGRQVSSFSEVNYSVHKEGVEWVAGANLLTDDFAETPHTLIPRRNYQQTTIGAFGQNTFDVSKRFSMETGLRVDHVIDYGTAVLPKVSLLFKINKHFASRLGGGLGYKSPTIFTEESERIQYRNVLGINSNTNKLERSYGGNWDINYKTYFDNNGISLSVNQLFFYTQLDDPLILTPVNGGLYRFINISGHIDAQGAETNIKLGYKRLKLYLGYTLTHSYIHQGSEKEETPLTPRHRTNTVLTYEIEGKLKIGAEAYYYSPQRLSDGSTGHDYWLCGLMAEKIWKHFSLFVNFENMLDIRQTKFGSIYTGSISNPNFKDIYAPLDGFVMNGGIKLRL